MELWTVVSSVVLGLFALVFLRSAWREGKEGRRGKAIRQVGYAVMTIGIGIRSDPSLRQLDHVRWMAFGIFVVSLVLVAVGYLRDETERTRDVKS